MTEAEKHLKFMSRTRPAGLDKEAVIWALAEIEWLRAAAAQVRAQAARENCLHPRKSGQGAVSSDGWSYGSWYCPDCGASGEVRSPPGSPALMPIYGATEDKKEDLVQATSEPAEADRDHPDRE